MPGPGIEPPISCMPSGCANHYTTAPLSVFDVAVLNQKKKDGVWVSQNPARLHELHTDIFVSLLRSAII